jgi:Icc-related predicted phosphoesterase
MKILAVSDIELGFIYNVQIAQRFKDVDMMISCGDLPYYYLEFMVSMLDKPLYFVRGNHASKVESTSAGERTAPWGAEDLHQRVTRVPGGLLMAGIEGSIRYNNGPHQYSQGEMWSMALGLVPRLMINRLRYGRFLDVLVTHAPPWKIHDMEDLPHHGIKAFRWLLQVFKPAYHLHGHIHVYRNDIPTITQFEETQVINCYGYRELTLEAKINPNHRSVQAAEGGNNERFDQ